MLEPEWQSEELPTEGTLSNAINIYVERLSVFLIIVIANLIILGLIVIVDRLPGFISEVARLINPSILTIIFVLILLVLSIPTYTYATAVALRWRRFPLRGHLTIEDISSEYSTEHLIAATININSPWNFISKSNQTLKNRGIQKLKVRNMTETRDNPTIEIRIFAKSHHVEYELSRGQEFLYRSSDGRELKIRYE